MRTHRPLLSAIPSLTLWCGIASAQWSADPLANLAVGDLPEDQVQAKLVATPDGGCFVSWLDNATGGYDVRLQRLNAEGIEQWPHNGILIADRAFSSTTDYSMVLDDSGDALIAYDTDLAVPGSRQIAVQRVTPAGTRLWGPTGTVVSAGAGVSGNARVARLSDGSVAVGWTQSPGFLFRRVDAAGVPLAPATTVSESGHTIFLCDLQPGLAGSIIATWTRSFTTNYATSSRWILAQCYNAAGAALWPPSPGLPALGVYSPPPNTPWPTGSGVYGTQGGSIQNGYFPYALSDRAGGIVVGYYENAGPRNAYVQHVLADGSLRFPTPGAAANVTGANRIRVGNPGVDYDPSGPFYYLASVESDASPQSNYSTFVQRVDAAGSRTWGAAGVTVVPVTGFQQSSLQVLARPGGCSVFGFDGRNAASSVQVGWAAGVRADAAIEFSTFFSTTVEPKSRLAAATSTRGFHVLAFQSGAIPGSSNLYAQDVLFTGALGPIPPACDPDLNQDGNVDQGDVAYLIDVVGGGSNPAGIDPDFNRDGNPDQGDVAALLDVVAGGNCP